MKHSMYKWILPVVMLSAGIAGCKKQLDINKNPNNVTESNITAELILPNALSNTGAQTALAYGWLANWMGYWSPSGSYNPNTEESTYNITSSFQETKWANIYNALFDLDVAETKAKAKGQDYMRAMAMIAKAHLFQNLVDLYGNIPYSQAFKPFEFPTPVYDKGEDVYASLQLKLDTAITLMENASVTSVDERVDIIYHGDAELWTKFANTIKLRMLIRNSITVPNPAAELAKITAHGGVLSFGESAAANPGYVNDANKQSPFYGAYGLTPSGNQANEYFRANAYIVTQLRNGADPRLEYFFKPAATPLNPAVPYVGTVYGRDPDVNFNGDRTSNIGEGLVKGFDQDQWIITSVESMFLEAEAVARGWLPGDAQEAYENAVYESFEWLGVENAEDEATAYLETSGADWANSGGSVDAKVKFIVKQKYLALIGINPLEAWNDYRRLGVPADVPLSVNQARGSRVIPLRLIYPSAEYAVNSANVQAQGNITPNTPVFWDK
ncbi:MAG: SusD/RagB family nutrient-binding outer membrane lipoprotein [Pseudobacter sp.]|uniref:SusD/RagB family nutrient-binding outer membrane lipoprotein n=1 Tax=Pseudobacter sp. TaxID=2045420 RepID=UPI003F80161D